MTDTTHANFEAWFLKKYGLDTALARMNYMKFNIYDIDAVWKAATLAAAPQWLPIADARQDGTEYWATDGTHYFTESQPPECFPGQWLWFEKEQCWGGSLSTYKATHFMSLPPTGGM